jgi:hypothetical protein
LVAIVVLARVLGAVEVVSTRLGAGAGAHTAQTKPCPEPFEFLIARPFELNLRIFELPSVSSRQPNGFFFWATACAFVDVNFNSFAIFSQSANDSIVHPAARHVASPFVNSKATGAFHCPLTVVVSPPKLSPQTLKYENWVPHLTTQSSQFLFPMEASIFRDCAPVV